MGELKSVINEDTEQVVTEQLDEQTSESAEVDGNKKEEEDEDEEDEKAEIEKGKEWIRKKREAEKKRIEEGKKNVKIQYYIDFGAIAIIGLVFFITCLMGILYGVSPKGLSIRAIVSVTFTSIVVFICRNMANNIFCSNKEHQENESREENKGKINE